MRRLTLAAIALLATSTLADAACTLNQLAGRWQTYAFGQVTASRQGYYQACTATISNRGAVRTSCFDSTGATSNPNGQVIASNAANCTFFIDFPGTRVMITFALDKNTGAGIMNFGTGISSFTATRL